MRRNNKRTKPAGSDAPALPFPPAGVDIDPEGMVAAALQLGGVLSNWVDIDPEGMVSAALQLGGVLSNWPSKEAFFYTDELAKQYSNSNLASARKE